MEIWQLWIVAAVILWLLEIFTPGFIAGAIGTACLITAPFAASSMTFSAQLAIFAISTVIIFFIARAYAKRKPMDISRDQLTNTEALLGMEGIVTDPINSDFSGGRVKLRGEDWSAVSLHGNPIATNTRVIVRKIEGCKVLVEAIN